MIQLSLLYHEYLGRKQVVEKMFIAKEIHANYVKYTYTHVTAYVYSIHIFAGWLLG